jgi:hypothetical protein
MSFGESVFLVRFNQKIIKVDLFIKINHVYPRQKQLKKILKDSRRQTTKEELKTMTCGAGQPHL